MISSTPILRSAAGDDPFCPDPAADVVDLRGIDRDGCLVLVRPDHYVAHVLPLDAHDEFTTFLADVLLTP